MMNGSVSARTEKPIVLCIDDEPAVLRSIKCTLQRLNITVLATDSPEKALAALRRYRISVLLTDLVMPMSLPLLLCLAPVVSTISCKSHGRAHG